MTNTNSNVYYLAYDHKPFKNHATNEVGSIEFVAGENAKDFANVKTEVADIKDSSPLLNTSLTKVIFHSPKCKDELTEVNTSPTLLYLAVVIALLQALPNYHPILALVFMNVKLIGTCVENTTTLLSQ
jgi:hypothetical protein